jgi:RNA polymerase sigma factor (sigma-70 family)
MSRTVHPPRSVIGDGQAWHQFLALLAPDHDRAASLYESLRKRLVDVFRWRGLAAADDLADEAIERAVRHVAAGHEIRNLASYLCGIASKLALEAGRREAKVAPLDDRLASGAAATDPAAEQLDTLDDCLAKLPHNSRELLLRYYSSEGARIADRKQIADDLGIGLNALRIRMHRLRGALETCLGQHREAA